ncbi:hypothetical protein AXF21_05290 [Eubacterium minutum ATCC 700079]|nr:hypothetical protein AXF21_05290 [Eubacterium minutum ATCC 700079]
MIEKGTAKILRKGQNDVRKYITSVNITDDGEVAEKVVSSLDKQTFLEDASFDGFYGVCTNLEDEPEKIINVMKGRWEIKECFRIMKSEFEARPIYLSISGFCTDYEVITAKKIRKIIKASKKA